LLMGDEYHRALFKKRNGSVDPPLDHEQDALIDDADDPKIPRPLPLSEDEHKVGLLTKAFDHLKGLDYADIPDYDLIQRSLEGFAEAERDYTNHNQDNDTTPPIDWNLLAESFKNNESKKMIAKTGSNSRESSSVPTWNFVDGEDGNDPLDSSVFAEAEASAICGSNEEEYVPLYGEAAEMARLPLELRFRVTQMQYNTRHNTTIESHLAMCDWLQVCLPLLHNRWNSKQYEKGGHRSNNDGYRREFFLKLVNQCLECAAKFGGFRDMVIIYGDENDDDRENGEILSEQPAKRKRRRKVHMTNVHEPTRGAEEPSNKGLTDLLAISKVLFELRMTKQFEEKLSRAPPPRLSFGT